jgi:hypothetical protein
MIGPKPAQAGGVHLDWRAYFRAFSEAHGGDPVYHGGRLLFADGWQYSSTDHAGPEWAPPESEEELRRLVRAYWKRRLQIVTAERKLLWERLKGLEQLQAAKSLPLQRTAREPDGEGRVKMVRGPLDLDGMRARLAWLADDIKWCQGKLDERGSNGGTDGGAARSEGLDAVAVADVAIQQ